MKNSILVMSLLSATVFMSPDITIASGILTHTHTNTPELKPTSHFAETDKSFKVTSVCFLGDNGCGSGSFSKGESDYDIDTVKQCLNEGFVNSCSSGYCMDGSCAYNKTYGKCLAENCPTNSSPSCTGAVIGKTACGGNCKQCCSDNCPSGSKSYSGSYASKTECGNSCYYCNTSCPSGSLSYSGSVVSYNECGQACRSCNSSCPSGTSTSNPGGCGGSTMNECRNKTCYYPYESCCSDSCTSGSKSYSGAYASTTECGSTCRYCSTSCSSGSTSNSGSVVGYNECGSACRNCSNSCSSGSTSSSCSAGYSASRVGSTECGNACYSCVKDDPCLSRSDASCSYGCQSYWADCSSKCQTCYADNCRNRTAVSAPYGCQSYFSDCLSKCQTAKGDPNCDVTSLTCSYGCKSTNTCGKCTQCKSKCDDNPCASGCYYDEVCRGSCRLRNSCGGCEACMNAEQCPGGSAYSHCNCGGTHGGPGMTAAHFCP